MKTKPENDKELYDKVNHETARIRWSELEKHFAAGAVVYVSEDLDLVDVAVRISHDDKDNVQRWMAEGKLHKVRDEQAQVWAVADSTLWASVVHPFVLVQPDKKSLH
ncbi:DUF2288 domain-containing protein [Massilia agilis]|uniref:DUF2288 domain-containing protein n=1 Tax=Massilia agilis TaxID=1811226 RepID=A0ABT2D9K8_9BURK|nr:DUF2288 domain-containing protein [Massilia agilis]MCS0807818.1 DUF2288 domain-containing protein [Massilia agilis]